MKKSLRYIARCLRPLGFYILDYLAILSAGRRASTAPTAAVFFMHGMGDLLLGTGMLDVLIQACRKRHFLVHLYIDEGAFELARMISDIDEIFVLRKNDLMRNPVYRWKCLRSIARTGYQVAIQPTYNRFFIIEDALIRAAGSAEKTGSSGSPMFITSRERLLSDRWYTRLIPCSPAPLHDIDRNQEFLRGLGLDMASWPQVPVPLLSHTASDRDGVVVMALGASHPMKSWPIERFEKLAHFIVKKTGLHIVFVGASGETSPTKSFRRWNADYFTDHVGKTDLSSLLPWIAHAKLIIANDSAIMHFSVLMRRRVVTIAGGGIPARYHPYPDRKGETQPVVMATPLACYGCGWKCRYMSVYNRPAPCLRAVPTTRVARAVLRELTADTKDTGWSH